MRREDKLNTEQIYKKSTKIVYFFLKKIIPPVNAEFQLQKQLGRSSDFQDRR
jgi:hypothetical protein